jgi:O-antigen/teichoic acid export membrane protein
MTLTWKNFKEKLMGQKGLLSIGLADIVGTGITSLFWLYIASILDPAEYGEIMYLLGIASLVQLISLIGNSNALTVYSAKDVKIQSTLFVMSGIATGISLIVVTIILDRVDTGILAIGYVVFSSVNSVLLGKKLFSKYSKLVFSQKILSVILAVGLYFVFDIYGIIYGLALSYIPHLIIFSQEFLKTKIDFTLITTRKNFIINNYAMNLTAGLTGTIDKLIIAPVLGFVLLGNYSLSLQMLTMMMMFSSIVYKYLLPYDASGESNNKIRKITIIISIIIAILGVTILPDVIDWLFPKFSDAKDTIQIMSIGVVPGTISILYSSKFLGMEKSRIVLITKLVSVISLSGGVFYFGPIYGTVGLGWIVVIVMTWEALFLFIINQKQKIS